MLCVKAFDRERKALSRWVAGARWRASGSDFT